MKIPFVDLKTQYRELQPQIQARINAVLDHGQYIMGPEVKELEERLQEYTGVAQCLTVSSGTALRHRIEEIYIPLTTRSQAGNKGA